MKAFVAVLALVAAVAGDVSILQPNSHLQPPVEQDISKDFNTPWTEENAWTPAADPHQPIFVPQESSYYASVHHSNNNQDYQQDHHQYHHHQEYRQQQGHYQNNNAPSSVAVQQSREYQQDQHHEEYPQQQGHYQNNNAPSSVTVQQSRDYQQDQHHEEYPQQQGHYQNNNAPSSAAVQVTQGHQQYQHQCHHHQEQPQQQGHYQNNNAPSSVAVQVTHPDWATSFSNVNRYNTYWPAAPVAPVMVAPVPFAPATPVFAAPAPFSKPTQAPAHAPMAVYNNNVAKWNPWNNQQHSHPHSHDIAKVPASVAKYIAITPGSVHIAPLPGHTVSHKFVNPAPAGRW